MEQRNIFKVKFKEIKKKYPPKIFDGIAHQIDSTGCFIQTKNELEEGSIIDLVIYDKEEPLVNIEAQVKWLGSNRMSGRHVYGLGVEFSYKSLKDYKKIKNFLGPKDEKNIFVIAAWILLGLIVLWIILK